ncbi:MAG: hypothetical protein JWN78_1611 [Bacteroidota bacterium]|nr:hypothetical protein [Bacteroidota bacterium]
MKYPKRNTRLWLHLYQNGFLDGGDEAVIQQEIKDYYKAYDRKLKHRKRKIERREFSLSFSNLQIKQVRIRAKEYGVTIPGYLKLLVCADLSQSSPLKHTMDYKEILQLLTYYKNTIDGIEVKETNKWFSNNNYDELRMVLESIKTKIEIK